MVKTIGNPLSWGAEGVGLAGNHLVAIARALGGDAHKPHTIPHIRRLKMADIRTALSRGLDDFQAMRTDVAALCLLYPIMGALLVTAALQDLMHLIVPILTGFALVGPVAAIGLYEMSRRREQGQHVSWADAFGVLTSPAFGAVFVLGLGMVVLFVMWMLAAQLIFTLTLGPDAPTSLGAFLSEVFTTGAGWAMIILGVGVGFVFALVALAVSVVSFPLLLDRDVGLPVAVATSVRVMRENPRVICAWGLVVAIGLALGTLPALLGLAIVLPVLGHATWHLYRRAVGN